MMEGVGARLGRSSSRYGPTTVFTGPVRKWKKKWVHVPPSSSSSNVGSSSSAANHQADASSNGNSNGSNGSHLLLYKWTPISQSQQNGGNNGGAGGGDAKDEAVRTPPTEEPSRRKIKYIPVAVLEEQKSGTVEQIEDEVKAIETDTDARDEKPDINDMPMEENQASDDAPFERQDLNKSTLDLSLNLNGHDEDNDSDSKADQTKTGQLDRVNNDART